jgi:hypothetical protein
MTMAEQKWNDGVVDYVPEVEWQDIKNLGEMSTNHESIGTVVRISLTNGSVLFGELHRVVAVSGTGKTIEVTLYLFPDKGYRGRLHLPGDAIESIQRQIPALPTVPGPYAIFNVASRSRTTDGHEFHYLRENGEWDDLGWGHPNAGDRLVPLVVRR